MEYYPRKIEEDLDRWMGRREAIIIKGPRQSGKTTLMLHLREKHGGSYVTLDDPDALRAFEGSPRDFALRYISGGPLFIDEAQYSQEAGRIIKLLHDQYGAKVVATGSGSFDVRVQIGKHLVGRAVYFELLPLSFEELLSWKAGDLLRVFREHRDSLKSFMETGKPPDVSPAFHSEFSSLLEEHVVYGGFPAIVKERDPEFKARLLKGLVQTYLEKDVFSFFNVREMEKFRAMLSYISATMGSMLEASSIMSDLHMDFRTVEGYLSVLTATYVIYLVPPFSRNLATELRKARKAYFVDTGLRNAVLGNFLPLANRTDRGWLLENFVANELRAMGLSVRHWRTTSKAEVDFVVEAGGSPVPVEVKSAGKPEGGLSSFIRAYRPRAALVFTEGNFGVRRVNETAVAYVPHYYV